MESDNVPYVFGRCPRRFLSTLSAWRATCLCHNYPVTVNISIHALRMESDIEHGYIRYNTTISIHALRMESDAA